MITRVTSLLCISLLFLASCSSVYIPNVPDSPMLSTRGEFHAGGHISPKGNVSFNSAYALTDHVGFLVSGSFMDNQKLNKEFNHQLIETGAGYFTTFGAQQSRILEIYAGLGRGTNDRNIKSRDAQGVLYYDRQETRYTKYFLQANYSSKEKKTLKLFGGKYPLNYGTVLRASYVNMDNFKRTGIIQPTEDNIFLEPVFFTRMVLNKAVQLQYTSGSNFGLKNRKYLTAGNSVFTFGIIYNAGGQNLIRK